MLPPTVVVLSFGGLRLGGATALRRSDVSPGGRLRVERSVRRISGRWVGGEPKTDAGSGTATLPAAIAAVLEDHLEQHVASLERLPAVRPHALPQTGATLAAATDAMFKELMCRLGHSSPAAALL